MRANGLNFLIHVLPPVGESGAGHLRGRNAEAAQVQGVHGQAGGGEGGGELGEDGGAIGKSVDKKQSGRAGGIQANGLGAAARGVRGVGAAGDAARVEGIGD